jgi:hypothetical protein
MELLSTCWWMEPKSRFPAYRSPANYKNPQTSWSNKVWGWSGSSWSILKWGSDCSRRGQVGEVRKSEPSVVMQGAIVKLPRQGFQFKLVSWSLSYCRVRVHLIRKETTAKLIGWKIIASCWNKKPGQDRVGQVKGTLPVLVSRKVQICSCRE